MRYLLIKTGSTVPNVAARRGDFEQWFAHGMGVDETALQVVEVYRGEPLPAVDEVLAVVVTGSAAMVTEAADWSLGTERWLAGAIAANKPTLGVCYGHQLLARALGGKVATNARGRQIGTVDVALTRAARHNVLTQALPETLHVPVSHSQAVVELPPNAVRLGRAPLDENHAFAYGDRTWGVQFHPEFDADIVRGYIDAREFQISAEGLDTATLRAQARDTPHGKSLLSTFAMNAKLLTS